MQGCKYKYIFEDGRVFDNLKGVSEAARLSIPVVGMYIKQKRYDLLGQEITRIPLSKIKEKEKNIPKTKIRKCTKCKKEFKTEVDERGFAINTRCNRCKKFENKLMKEKTGLHITRIVY